MNVDYDHIRNNPSDNVLRELKQSHCFKTEKRNALTKNTYGHKASVHFLMRVYACFIAIGHKKILRVVSIKVFKRG